MKKSYVKYISALFIFGSNGIVSSYINLDSYEIVFLRTLIGTVFLSCIFLLSKHKLQMFENKKDFFYLFVSGASTGVSWIFLYQAYSEIGVSLATLAYYCGPIFIIILSHFIFKERLDIYKIVGCIIVFIGMIFINGNQSSNGSISFGLICGILAGLSYSILIIVGKMVKTIDGLEYTLIQITSSLLTVSIFIIIKQGFYIPDIAGNIIPILFLGIVNTGIGFYLCFSSIKKLPGGTIAICGYLEPLSALCLSALFLGEKLSYVQIIGAFCIIGGSAFAELYKYINFNKTEASDSFESTSDTSIDQ